MALGQKIKLKIGGLAIAAFALAFVEPVLGDIPKSDQKFEISPLNSKWYQSPPPPGLDSTVMLFRKPEIYKGLQGTLSIREDLSIAPGMDIQRYVRKWVAELSQFNLKLVTGQYFQHNGEAAYTADILNPKSKRSSRQFVYFRPEAVFVLTCTDHEELFAESVKVCSAIARTFKWKVGIPKTKSKILPQENQESTGT